MPLVLSSLFGLLVLASLIPCVARFTRSGARWGNLSAAVITAAALACGVAVAIAGWRGGFPLALDLSHASPFPFLLSIDRLSGFFLFVVCAVSIPAVSYSFPYIAHRYPRERAPWYLPLLPFFLLSLIILVPP